MGKETQIIDPARWLKKIRSCEDLKGLSIQILLQSEIRDMGDCYRITIARFHKEILSPERADEIRECLAMRKPVKFGAAKAQIPQTPHMIEQGMSREERQAKIEEFSRDPVVKQILDTFDGEVLNVC